MTKQAKSGGAPIKKAKPAIRLGRSAVTGRFVLEPAKKAGGSVSVEEFRKTIRTVLHGEKA